MVIGPFDPADWQSPSEEAGRISLILLGFDMPIRPENRARYPKDWKAISASIRDRAKNRCEECGLVNGALGGRLHGEWCEPLPLDDTGRLPQPGDIAWCRRRSLFIGRNVLAARLKIVRIVLTVAHLDHQPENCAPSNLKAWCQRCHNRYDAKTRAAGIKERRRAIAAVGDLFCA